MIWSYSAAKMFRQCQLQWFLKTKVANAKAKDPFRREAYLYALTVLAWTQPEGCSRYPITLKLNDRYLRDEASDYDADALDFAELSDNDEEVA